VGEPSAAITSAIARLSNAKCGFRLQASGFSPETWSALFSSCQASALYQTFMPEAWSLTP
jgi:hypothetical protein